jgi:Family of unknown function (DUF5999)
MTGSTIMLKPALRAKDRICPHQPWCPDALAPDRIAAWPVARRPEQGWSLLCNGVVLFDDGGQLLPDGRAISPAPTCTAADLPGRAAALAAAQSGTAAAAGRTIPGRTTAGHLAAVISGAMLVVAADTPACLRVALARRRR